MWDDSLLGGEVQHCMIERVRWHVRHEVFTPWKILKAMDLAGFNLSLAGIEVLRRVESSNKYSRGFLPSKSTIFQSARKVEALADSFCPFTMIGRTFAEDLLDHVDDVSMADDSDVEESFGEGFEFDCIKITETLFEAFGLTNEAKRRSVELRLTSDGAQLTNTISHVAAGLKFNDMG
jgi:hypothetical protein